MMVAVSRVVVQGWSRDRAIAQMNAAGFDGKWSPIEHYVRTLNVLGIRRRLASAPPVQVEWVP